MESYHFLGLPQSQWQFINTFADWISALGTVGAVAFSLWLTRNATRPKARVTANVMLAIVGDATPSFLDITVANTGDRPFTVTGVGWRVGLPFARRFAYQKADGAPPYAPSHPLPIELGIGRSGSWRVDLERVYQRETWAQDFSKKFLGRYVGIGLWTLRVQAFTTTGHVFTAKPADSLIKRLREARTQGVKGTG